MVDWSALRKAEAPASIAAALLQSSNGWDYKYLALDPIEALQDEGTISIDIGEALDAGCLGGGYYRAKPPTIYLHPSSRRRDNFTVLHEFGHHLQQHHPDWSYELMELSRLAGTRLEEAVSHEIAGQILMPVGASYIDSALLHPADLMAGLFEATQASRAAVMTQVAKRLPVGAKWIFTVSNAQGVVQASTTTYGDLPPAKDSTQGGLAALFAEASERPVRRQFGEGIRYRNGSELDRMRVEAVLGHDGTYLFAALTPMDRFGVGQLVSLDFECSNSACGESFDAHSAGPTCPRCRDPKCPNCNRCACDPTATKQVCDKCFYMITPGELAAGSHECP